jgi:hypothetical protein
MFGVVNNDAIIDYPKGVTAGVTRARVSFLTCDKLSLVTLYPKTGPINFDCNRFHYYR